MVQPGHVELLAVHAAAAAVEDRLHGGTHGGVAGACGLDAEGLAYEGVARARRDETERAARDGAVLALHEAVEQLRERAVTAHHEQRVDPSKRQRASDLARVSLVLGGSRLDLHASILEHRQHDPLGEPGCLLLATNRVVDEDR